MSERRETISGQKLRPRGIRTNNSIRSERRRASPEGAGWEDTVSVTRIDVRYCVKVCMSQIMSTSSPALTYSADKKQARYFVRSNFERGLSLARIRSSLRNVSCGYN
ncbi:hypothetical protein Mp_5g03440 [Marchantia polymorpha subsp. ruderalis]|uniref:Uncharacterized protein n=2 Tax=Marchantia polymorpha TaxID=3197 RepID=A0AAF6BEI7_MARPO|nr:hypothetical protein MARPO_0133s0043 [Marchantia polymorpha]BBN10421.1 hypothetical protein Mp_5g03440 [Marchantia polymorpha subsp. ruderalis]|eukprot:PTQ29902.1 hypothetical protein MARPO_0133s0043 [Marchantia polymorpha]